MYVLHYHYIIVVGRYNVKISSKMVMKYPFVVAMFFYVVHVLRLRGLGKLILLYINAYRKYREVTKNNDGLKRKHLLRKSLGVEGGLNKDKWRM